MGATSVSHCRIRFSKNIGRDVDCVWRIIALRLLKSTASVVLVCVFEGGKNKKIREDKLFQLHPFMALTKRCISRRIECVCILYSEQRGVMGP